MIVEDSRPWEVREFGDIYRALGARNRTDIEGVDELLVSEVAGLLGIGRPEPEAREVANDGLTAGQRRAVERMRAAEEGRPPPEPEVMGQDAMGLIGMLGGGDVGAFG